MKKIKKKSIFVAAVILLSIVLYLAVGIFDYLDYMKAVRAVGGMPWQDGGKIIMVREPCVLDTPANAPTTCAISCPLVTSVWATACTGFIEIDVVGQMGSNFIAAPTGFKYSGGGIHPTAGTDFISGGASPGLPWVIGIPGKSASRIQKLVNSFNFIIAGMKN